jgi:hypothetical protein
MHVTEKYIKYFHLSSDDQENLHCCRLQALIYLIAITITSQIMLNNPKVLVIYTIMPIHFLLIRYLANYVMLEGRHYIVSKNFKADKNRKLSSNITSININALSIITIAYFSVLSTNLHFLQNTILIIQVVTTLYVIFIKSHYRTLFYYLEQADTNAFKVLGIRMFFIGLSIVASAFIGICLMYFPVSSAILLLALFIIIIPKLIKTFSRVHLIINFTASVGYGVVLFIVGASMLLFLFHDNNIINTYKITYTLEPVMSLAVSLFFLKFILKNKVSDSDNNLLYYTSLSNLLLIAVAVSVIFLKLNLSYATICFIIILASYAIIEYTSSFNITQVIYKSEMSQEQASIYNMLNSALRGGGVPAVFVPLVYFFHEFLGMHDIADVIVYSVLIIISTFMLINSTVLIHLAKLHRSYKIS